MIIFLRRPPYPLGPVGFSVLKSQTPSIIFLQSQNANWPFGLTEILIENNCWCVRSCSTSAKSSERSIPSTCVDEAVRLDSEGIMACRQHMTCLWVKSPGGTLWSTSGVLLGPDGFCVYEKNLSATLVFDGRGVCFVFFYTVEVFFFVFFFWSLLLYRIWFAHDWAPFATLSQLVVMKFWPSQPPWVSQWGS